MSKPEQYFEEENWNKYSSLFSEGWTNTDFQQELLGVCNGQLDLARVIFHHMGENSLTWMNSNVPALDRLKPLECLADEKLTKRLKVCLLRFPTK